ncbi:MAG: ComEA family DNA-binding protein [Myxococcota bacterium]
MQHETRTARASLLAMVLALGMLLSASPTLAAGGGSLTGVVNINTATLEQLQMLPGIGESRARAVVAIRKKTGGFKSVDELAQVKGIGPVALERLRPFVRMQGKTTARIE